MQEKKKVLVVDDSAVARRMAVTLLQRYPFDIITACNGAEGVEVATAERPDLILMDVMMPQMNGFDAVRALRREPITVKIPVVMVTSKGDEERVREGYAAGCSDYVTKPIDPAHLLKKVRFLLEMA